MNHEIIYGHKEDRVVDPTTFVPFCRRCRDMMQTISSEKLKEIVERENAKKDFDRAMKGVGK